MTVVDVVGSVKASTREAAAKKVRAKVGKNLYVHCNPAYGPPDQRIPGLWRCEVTYKKGGR